MSLSTDLTSTNTAVNAAQSSALKSSSLLKNVTRYEDLATTAASKSSSEMGKQDFLTLFTAQLKNQDPLDPVKNEAFVAQLAQFSQLEALTNMQTSMDTLSTTMTSERLQSSASLIGRRISLPDVPSQLGETGNIDATLDLPDGASGIKLTVKDSSGSVVQELISGAQTAGTTRLSWDGTDSAGNRAPAGNYRLSATAVVNGKNTTIPVNTMTTVLAVDSASDGSVSLQVQGGQSVLLKNVSRFSL